jgi:hypothetical protein
MLDRSGKNIRAQYHPCPAASGRIVNGAMLIARKVTDLNGRARPLPLLQRSASQGYSQRSREHFRIEREDLRAESHD